jgi:hypothetical protein
MRLPDFTALFTNWKTTSAGVALILTALLVPLTDGDPATVVRVGEKELTAILLGIGLIFARDANKSSQDSGIRPEDQKKP